MAEEGDMFFGRKRGNRLMRWLSPRILGFRAGDHFRAQVPLREGFDLARYGWAAKVVELPGHSQGSVGVLSEEGELFCGDTLANQNGKVGPGMGDPADFVDSIEKVKGLKAERIYPGHGEPFGMEAVV
jgi:glyoxylase-like metal-dependent hydrolase (beta-lactamase superfamily II)